MRIIIIDNDSQCGLYLKIKWEQLYQNRQQLSEGSLSWLYVVELAAGCWDKQVEKGVLIIRFRRIMGKQVEKCYLLLEVSATLGEMKSFKCSFSNCCFTKAP